MSCGNGCGCCPKCGCRATCTCNQSMWFDETMGDFSYIRMKTVAGEDGHTAGTCVSESSSDRFFWDVTENGANSVSPDDKYAMEGAITFE